MDPIFLVILFAELILSLSVLYGLLRGRIFMMGRWIYRTEGFEFWGSLITQAIILAMFIHFLGWKVF